MGMHENGKWKMENLDEQQRQANIKETNAKAEHLLAQAELWRAEAELKRLEVSKRKK